MTTRSAAARELHLERLLRVGTCLAQCGYGAQVAQLAACARALRADAQLWAAHARHRGRNGRTVLMQAAWTGNVDRVKFLLDCGAGVEAATRYGGTALMMACEAGHCEAAHLLVERGGANVNAAIPSDGMTALMWACKFGRLDIVRFLVERGGANVNLAGTSTGTTALMVASEFGRLDTVRFLVEHGGANVNAARTDSGLTALMWASRKGHVEIARLLVERGGANVNAARTDDGQTALMLAGKSFNSPLEIVRLLLELGADKHARDHAGASAYIHAIRDSAISSYFHNTSAVTDLLKT